MNKAVGPYKSAESLLSPVHLTKYRMLCPEPILTYLRSDFQGSQAVSKLCPWQVYHQNRGEKKGLMQGNQCYL